MRISDWSSDVCSSDLAPLAGPVVAAAVILDRKRFPRGIDDSKALPAPVREAICARLYKTARIGVGIASVEEIDRLNIYWARMLAMTRAVEALGMDRSEEHTSELQSLMRISYAVFCLKKNKKKKEHTTHQYTTQDT